MTGYKVTDHDGAAFHGGKGIWTPGEWRTVKPPVDPCRRGLHYCRRDQVVHWIGPVIWTFEDADPENTVDAGDKMVTTKGRVVARVETWNETTARLFAADVAELALRFVPETHRDPFVRSINAARGFARGEIGDKERAAAWAAARDAARAAAWDAAGDAAGAAAWAAVRAAARDAAWDAARDAAWAAARAAAKDAQTEILFDYIKGRRS